MSGLDQCHLLVVAWFLVSAIVSAYESPNNSVAEYIWAHSSGAESKPISLYRQMPLFATSKDFGKNGSLQGGSRPTLVTLIMSNSYSGEMPVGAISTKAMQLALDRLRMQQNWLPGYELSLELIDDECIDSTTINRVIPKLRENEEAFHRFPLFLSPACEAFGMKTVAETIKYFNFIGLTTIQTSIEPFRNRKRFSSFFSLGEQSDLPHIALASFIAEMGWKKVAILSEKFPYYDELENTLLPLLGANNVSLLWIGKVSHSGVYEEEMKMALDEMIAVDPRIIIVDADRGAGKACWLHRYGLFGPNYVTFFFYWSDVYPTPTVPENMDWCTIDMINEVMASSIILGDTTITDTFGSDIADSTGLTGKQWEAVLDEELNNPEDNSLWAYWRMLAYDLTLFTGYVLNKTESLLQKRQETLLDWVTTSSKFARNGSVISKILKEAIYSTAVKGLKGEYHFEENTSVNSLGYTPITFTQLQKIDGKFQGVLIAVYKSNDLDYKFRIFEDKVVWRTHDGLPPKDSVSIVLLERPPMPQASYAVLLGFASVEFLSIIGLIIIIDSARRRPNLPIFRNVPQNVSVKRAEDIAIVFGNTILLAQIFALPLSSHNLATHCYAITTTVFVGYSTSIFGLAAKIEVAYRHSGTFYYSTNGSFSASGKFWTSLSLAIWIVVQISLLGAFFKVAPFQIVMNTMAMEKTNSEINMTYLPFDFKCQLSLSTVSPFDDSRHARVSILIASGCLHGLLLLRTVFTAIKLNSRPGLSGEMRYSCTCFYCVVLLLVAGVFISALINELLTVLSSFILCYVGITTVLLVAVKLFPKSEEFPRFNRQERNLTVMVSGGALTALPPSRPRLFTTATSVSSRQPKSSVISTATWKTSVTTFCAT